ncbi:MAG TPA: alpha/beta fold hydrolase [Paucimonas sp.]|nr:alpha/beta fold hydrolase [Paucimonas sp.]
MHTSSWLMRQSAGGRRFRLFCFSYAGGSAAPYLAWQTALPSFIEVCAIQLPGRGPRLAELPIRSLPQLIETLAPIIAREADLPFAFFGHSLGGLLAFELARHCQRHHLPMPEHLFVSASNAPRHRRANRRLHELDDDALIDALKDYNGTPPAALADRELMTLLLPAIRADFALVETYEYRQDVPLDIPITVLAGTNDKHVVSERLCRWQDETTEACSLRWFEGDHFFIHSNQDAVLDCIQDELADLQYA